MNRGGQDPLSRLLAEKQMSLSKMCLRPPSPGADEPVIQARANRSAGERNHASRPLFHDFRAGFGGDSLDDPRHEFVDDFFFQQLAAYVDSGGAGRGNPQLGNFIVGIEFEAVDEA